MILNQLKQNVLFLVISAAQSVFQLPTVKNNQNRLRFCKIGLYKAQRNKAQVMSLIDAYNFLTKGAAQSPQRFEKKV